MTTIIATPNAKHAYEIQIGPSCQQFVRVEANNRSQARKAAEAAGYEVLGVNMVA